MAIPTNVKTALQTEQIAAHTQHMTEIKATRAVTNGVVRTSAARQFDEPGPAEARAVDKVLRLPT